MSIEEVRSYLHTRELRHKKSGSTCTYNQAFGLVASSTKGHGNYGNFFSRKSENSKGGTKPNDVCNYCKEKGHWKKECP